MITKYSNKLNENIGKICSYYEKYDNFKTLQKIILFMVEATNYIDEKYFLLDKQDIEHYINEGKKIWMKEGNEKNLAELNVSFMRKVLKIKSYRKILENKMEHSATECILSILYNGYDDPQNQFIYDFLELYIANLETLNIEEEKVKKLLKKHFNEIIKLEY